MSFVGWSIPVREQIVQKAWFKGMEVKGMQKKKKKNEIRGGWKEVSTGC